MSMPLAFDPLEVVVRCAIPGSVGAIINSTLAMHSKSETPLSRSRL